MRRKILILITILLGLCLNVASVVQAGDCEVYQCDEYCESANSCEPVYCYDCEGSVDVGTCPPNYHMTPNGGCQENGTGEETCFPAGTGITMSSGERKNIEEVRVGDEVMSMNEAGQLTTSTVERLLTPVSDSMCRIEFVEGESLEVTESHPLMTTEGWKAIDVEAAEREKESVPVTELKVGDRMVREDGSNHEVTKIVCWSETVQTYNFTVDNAHTYFAEGYLAHNKRNPPECTWDKVDCPADRIRVDQYTDSLTGPLAGCPIGTAQHTLGDCGTIPNPEDPENPICVRDDVRTYTCCPVGTTAQCANTLVGTYTAVNLEANRYSCSAGDVYVASWYAYQVTVPFYNCETDDQGEEYCHHDSRIDTYYYTLCNNYETVCSCATICNSTAPTNLVVTQGASASTATMSWRSGTGGASQRIYVGTSQAAVDSGCTTGTCIVNASVTPFSANTNYTYPVTSLALNTPYYFRVVTYENASCTPSVSTTYTTPNVSLSGRVYLDASNNCSPSNPWSLGGLTVSVQNTAYSGSVGSDGRFAFYGGLNTPVNLVLSGFSGSYVPSTAAGCNSGTTLTSVPNPNTSSPAYFYLTQLREAWWQTVGGSIYANGSVRSEIPSSSEDLITAGTGGALGALMRSTGTVDTGAGAVSTEGYSALMRYRGKTMNYDYFAAHMGVTPNTSNDWGADTMNKPANNPNKTFYYLDPTGSEASVSTPWTVADGESYVVFVDGDLRIASSVTVEPGGFVAFIVNGDMRVSPAVADIQGLFVVDGATITETNGGNDVPAGFEGSVVSWGGVSLGRDLGAGNNLPAESFTYRPDLLVNMPDAMKVFALKWEEVVPGTIGN